MTHRSWMVLFLSATGLLFAVVVLASLRELSRPDLSCAIVHMPKAGCPRGYIREPEPRFTERDGSKQFACVSLEGTKPLCTDALYPGESEAVTLTIGGTQ